MRRPARGPERAHPFGTDDLGRDIFARVLVATRLSLLLTLGATAIAEVGGGVLGGVRWHRCPGRRAGW